MPGDLTSVEPVRKSVTVPAAPRRAFELFTAHIQEWWPLKTVREGYDSGWEPVIDRFAETVTTVC
jgi:hypothetical protein